MYIQNKEAMCLTERQTDLVYKAIEEGNMINTKTITCESMTCTVDQCQDDNPYKRVGLNNVYKNQIGVGLYLVTMLDTYNMTK